jgi:rRNA processing protein Gar1
LLDTDAQDSYMNIKLNDNSDNDESTAVFQENQVYYNESRQQRGRRNTDENNSKSEKSQQRIRQAFM